MADADFCAVSPPLLAQDAEVAIIPNGEVTDPGWALSQLNDATVPASPVYRFPETTAPVRLYLIDNSVDPSFFDHDNILSIETSYEGTDPNPDPNRTRVHATRMLGVIAGSGVGVAQGTPIEVVNYDIYNDSPEGPISSAGLLGSAINKATFHHEIQADMPGIICIAAGSSSLEGHEGNTSALENAIETAVDLGLTVIVSAGNEGGDAANFVPAKYGDLEGVICVGSIGPDLSITETSNTGADVDLYAPGEQVRTVDAVPPVFPAEFDTANGTSAAASVVTGAAIALQSLDPSLSPAQLEAKVKSFAIDMATGGPTYAVIQLPRIDSDGDGVHDLFETFSGSDPLDETVTPQRPAVTGSANPDGSTSVAIQFEINANLFDANQPSVLTDGTPWVVLESTNHAEYTPSTGGVFVYGDPVDGRRMVTYTRTGSEACCFLRLKIGAED